MSFTAIATATASAVQAGDEAGLFDGLFGGGGDVLPLSEARFSYPKHVSVAREALQAAPSVATQVRRYIIREELTGTPSGGTVRERELDNVSRLADQAVWLASGTRDDLSPKERTVASHLIDAIETSGVGSVPAQGSGGERTGDGGGFVDRVADAARDVERKAGEFAAGVRGAQRGAQTGVATERVRNQGSGILAQLSTLEKAGLALGGLFLVRTLL